MLKKTATLFLLLGVLAPAQAAFDEVYLKDKGQISGHILLEKKDQVVVDLGYTVLVVPRESISRIVLADQADAPPAMPEKTNLETELNLYATPQDPLERRSVRELVGELGESVVQVRTPGGLGSGFFINGEGYLITNFHVIEGESEISIDVYHQKGQGQIDRHVYKDVRIVAMNKFMDLALLKVDDADAPKFHPVYLGDTDSLAVGEDVFAIGSPLGLERTVTEGILSTKARMMQGSVYLQTNAQINPGNSGGPLFNLRGEVVGVTNMKMSYGEGLGFAIPIEEVKSFLKHRDAFAYDNDNPTSAYRYLKPPRKAAAKAD